MGTNEGRARHWLIPVGSGILLMLMVLSLFLPPSSTSAPVVPAALSPVAHLPLIIRPLSTSTGPVDGQWIGTTTQPAPVLFTVTTNGTVWKNVVLTARNGNCATLIFLDGSGPISGGRFSSSSQGSSIAGQFTSRTTANGTFTVAFNGACGVIKTVSGTWTAAPETPPTATPTKTTIATATPTKTTIATATPTRTPIPTPTAGTPLPNTVSIVGPTFAYVDTIGNLHVIGEVQNGTNTNVQFVQITANFFNANQQPVGTTLTYAGLDLMPPNAKTCFNISLHEPVGWASYQFEPVTYSSTNAVVPHLTILNDSGSVDPNLYWYTVNGQVRNDDTVQVNFVEVVGTVYNAAGKAIGCQEFFGSNQTSGQTAPFSILFLGRDYRDVTSYRLQPDGTRQ
jgi:hypothetical protein